MELYKKLDAIEAESPKNASSTASTASTNAINVIRSSLDLSDPFVFPLKKIMDKVYDEHLK